MKPDFSVIQLMLEATWVVQAVVLLLILASILSWAAIFRKGLLLRRVQRLSDEFERDFWSGGQLNELYQAALQRAPDASPTERIFASGMREFHKLRDRRVSQPDALLDGARRAMRASLQREVDALEANMSFLGSVGSVAPYVGLFGTVWGIMHAFTAIGAMAQVTLAVVAPGIAEALVATAISLFAAIPAVVAYNRFAHDIDRAANRMESFIDEFSNILQRNVAALGQPGQPGAPGSSGASLSSATAGPR
ncbi:MAG: protein TolQ [Serpentinimonas sp.]|nr:protein TolQ [Serpentinimonas sp.]